MFVERKVLEKAIELALNSVKMEDRDLFYIELQSIIDAIRKSEDIRIVG